MIKVEIKLPKFTHYWQFDLPAAPEALLKIYQKARVNLYKDDLAGGKPDISAAITVGDREPVACFYMVSDDRVVSIDPESIREALDITEAEVLDFVIETI